MNTRPTTIRVFGSSLVADPYTPQFRPYSYNGTDRLPAVPDKLKTGIDSPPCDEPGCGEPSHAVRLCVQHYYRYRAALKKDPSIKRVVRRGFNADACGTIRGYERHRYWKVPACDRCQDAKCVYDRERRAARKEAAA